MSNGHNTSAPSPLLKVQTRSSPLNRDAPNYRPGRFLTIPPYPALLGAGFMTRGALRRCSRPRAALSLIRRSADQI